MVEIPFHLAYDLNRRQRLIPHLKLWWPYSGFWGACLAGSILISVYETAWFSLMAVFSAFVMRGFFVGLLDVVLCPKRHWDLLIQRNGLGYLAGKERWWISLDGILWVKQLYKGIWTIHHYNGSVVNIPVSLITSEQIEYLKAAIRPKPGRAKANSPEGHP